MDSLKQQWGALAVRVDALTLRERAMVFAAWVAVIYGLWSVAVGEPWSKAQKGRSQLVAELETKAQALHHARDEWIARSKVDPNRDTKARIAQLQMELANLRLRQTELAQSFISPQSMAQVLRELLEQNASLELISLKTEGARSLLEDPLAVKKSAADDEYAPAVYRHDLNLEFVGGYFDMLTYLRALEHQPVFWDSVDYQVEEHPRGRIRLRVYTLSFDKEWLGV